MLRAKSQIASPNPKKAKSIARLGTPQEMGAPMRSMLRRLARELSAEGFVKTANTLLKVRNKRIHSTMKQILKAMKASNPATTVATTPT